MASSDVLRAAVGEDAARILSLLRNFHAAGSFDFPFDAPRLHAFVVGAIASSDNLVLVAGQPVAGVLIATRVDSSIAPYASAMERLIWVEPSGRGRLWDDLVDAFEAWAREQGCKEARLFSQAKMRGDAVGRLFRRRGYEPLETTYRKQL